jgi:hypothetical protein
MGFWTFFIFWAFIFHIFWVYFTLQTTHRKFETKIKTYYNQNLTSESLRDESETETEASERGAAASGELKVKMKPNE